MTIDLNTIRKTPSSKTAMQLMVDTKDYEELQEICVKEKLKKSQVIRNLISDFLELYRKKEITGMGNGS